MFYETEKEKELSEQELLRKREIRQEQANRIREAMQKKRELKKQEQEQLLSKLTMFVSLHETEKETALAEMLKEGFDSIE